MPREVHIRFNYQHDIAALARLGNAVDRDKRRNRTWRERVTERINALIAELLQANKNLEENGVKRKPDKGKGVR
jgi:thioester reductase-like protein